MPFNVNDFKARLGGQLSNPARFRVMLTGGIFQTEDVRMLAFLCNQAQLPGRQFATTEYTTHGPTIKIPFQNIYDDVVLSFYCKEDMEVKGMFQNWQNYICNNDGSNEFTYFDDYTANIIVEQFDGQGNITYSCSLVDVYPMMVSPLQLDWATQNGFHNLQVTFAYRYWKEEPVKGREPFGNFMSKNNLYPEVDIAGELNRTGASVLSEEGGQIILRQDQSLNYIRNFGKKARQSLSVAQHDLSFAARKIKGGLRSFTDRNLLFDV